MSERIQFSWPTATSWEQWRIEFERSFSDYLFRVNKPMTEFVSPFNSNSKVVAKSNGGFALYVDGTLKEEWNP